MFSDVGFQIFTERGVEKFLFPYSSTFWLDVSIVFHSNLCLLCPLSFRALWYSSFALLKICSELDMAFNLFSTDIGTCFRTHFGWFVWLCLYSGLSSGLRYGL